MEEVFHVRIKKRYAAELIEDLIRAKALEIVKENEAEIPDWQKEAVRQTLKQIQNHPDQLKSWDEIKDNFMRSK